MDEAISLGKKIFFLYPPPVLSEVAEELAKSEYEVYLVKDHKKLRKVLAAKGESILFVNIDQPPDAAHWESYVKEVLCDGECREVGVGIITLNDINPEVREKYLMQLQVPCGFIVLKLGTAKAIEILKRTLEANEARGKRKYVRALCPPGSGQCNVEFEGKVIYGEISEISSAGMAVSFQGSPVLRTGTILRKIAIAVRGIRLIVDGFVAQERASDDGTVASVIMFIPSSVDEQRSEKLKILVYKLNQYAMDQLLLATG